MSEIGSTTTRKTTKNLISCAIIDALQKQIHLEMRPVAGAT
jgi:hypothetical protein